MDADEKLLDLENFIIPQMEMQIEAAENNRRLRGLLKSLEEAVYEAEELLDLHDYYLLEQEVKSSAGGIKVCLESLPSLIKDLLFSVELKKSLMKLENTAAKAKKFLPRKDPGISNVRGSETANESRRSIISQLPVKVFGRDKQRDDIVDLLHETERLQPESEYYSVVAIVGLGGAGKTTLARYVYGKEAKAKHFDITMWVHVSERLDVKKLTREMVELTTKNGCDLTSHEQLQKKLKDSIRAKKFLLVLDDVWSENETAEQAEQRWEELLAPLREGDRGSKILMTTREEGVAKVLRARNILGLKELEENDLLSLFTYYAFGDAFGDAKIDDKLYEELEEIVRQNAPKLHSSPLAARMVASQLRNRQLRNRQDVDFWKRILSGDLLKDTRKSLMWSYQNLDADLQRCFSYCSLFSKGQKIRRKKLIDLWIAEGFVKTTDESERIEDIGQDYFNKLLSSSFFQQTEDDDLYTMHDLLHDLAEMVSKDQCCRVEGNLTEAVVPPEIRHLSLRIDRHLSQHIDSHLSLRNDRHLSLRIDTLSDIVEKICNLKNLRTLIFLTRTDDYYFNDHRMHYYFTDDLMHNIFIKLKKLRVVDIGEFRLGKLPESIGGLKHLRYLDLHKSSVGILPKSIYALYHLEFLHINECTFEAKGLANWKKLHHLCCSHMILNVAGTSQVLEGLRAPPELHSFTILGYQGCLVPSWMVEDRHLLHNLIPLELNKYQQLKQLLILSPTLGKLVLSHCSLPIVSEGDLAIIRSIPQDVRISQVVTFMEGLVATNRSCIVSKICWYLRRGYDSQKLRNWLEEAMGIVYQNLQEEEAQLVLPPSLYSLEISSCLLTDSTLRECLRGLTSLTSLKLCNIVSLTSLPLADVLGCLTVLKELEITRCWFLTSLGGLKALGSLQTLSISFCPSLSAEVDSTSILPSSLRWLEIEACHWKQYLDDSLLNPTSSINSGSSDIPFAASLQLGHLESLFELNITNCPNIGSLLGLQKLNNLGRLILMGCPKLAHAETKLGSLVLNLFCTDAPSLLDVLLAEEALASLQYLRIKELKEESFSWEEEQVKRLTSLKDLFFYECSIKSLPNSLKGLSSLQELCISVCPNITSLPDLPRSLSEFRTISCNPVLKGRCQKPHGQDCSKIPDNCKVAFD